MASQNSNTRRARDLPYQVIVSLRKGEPISVGGFETVAAAMAAADSSFWASGVDATVIETLTRRLVATRIAKGDWNQRTASAAGDVGPLATKPADVQAGFVYVGLDGETRIVVSVERPSSLHWQRSLQRRQPQPVVNWRTANPDLPAGGKAQGSATVMSFLRWSSSARPATAVEQTAFERVQRMRQIQAETRAMVRVIRRRSIA